MPVVIIDLMGNDDDDIIVGARVETKEEQVSKDKKLREVRELPQLQIIEIDIAENR